MGKASTPTFKVGVISSAHGVRGQVKIYSFSENPEDLISYGDLHDASGKRQFKLTRHGVKANQLIASIEGLTDRNEAEKLKGTELFASTSLQEYAEDEYSYASLTGITARTESGHIYGTICNVYNFGAGDIIELQLPNGQTEMLPFATGFFGEVNIEKREITVTPPDYIEPETSEPEDEE